MLQLILTEVNINNLLGSALDKLGLKEEAIKDYTRAINIKPEESTAYSNRG